VIVSQPYQFCKWTLTVCTARPSFNLSARSTLPIGAGLGSSASFSVCIATALLLLHQRISIPSLPEPSRDPGARSSTDPGHIHVSHQGRRAIPPDIAEEVNRWAFIGEKVLHGTPSGVDNSVSVFGGALAYTKSGFAGKKGGMEPIQGFKSLKFLLTDSKVPRDTKSLVAGVAARKAEVSGVLFKRPQIVQLTTSHRILRRLTQFWMRFRVFLTRLVGLWQTQSSNERNFLLFCRYGRYNFFQFRCRTYVRA